MPLLDNFLHMDFIATTLMLMRFLLIPLVCYNLWWSSKGFFNLLRGRNFPTTIYQSVVFAACTGIVGFQLLAISGVRRNEHPAITLFLLCAFFLTNILAAFGRRYNVVMNFEKFYWLFQNKNLDIAIRAAHLNEFDSKFTHKLVSSAEDQMAVEMLKRTLPEKDLTPS